MAKCVVEPRTNNPVRVSDDEAAKIVARGGKYISKNEWKRLTATAETKK